jgi:hypothetical protein
MSTEINTLEKTLDNFNSQMHTFPPYGEEALLIKLRGVVT